ncbi:MAG: hypothetical protein AVDCRST_MAG28-3523 [uncultured Rubrobacteraceae bacterium]|uniref:Uncharacterized protein n=1 Tax=uncultured Rubrobacteraceae bacterium TaxID=349277 RepID=A0A6J4R2J9_9ACTN|nr:MAG: hypothetical protein AVDCRST_MAG28-3523 [uncultured Rubrobacteraceae bacterium]
MLRRTSREHAPPTGTTGLIFDLLDDEMRVFDHQDHTPGGLAGL